MVQFKEKEKNKIQEIFDYLRVYWKFEARFYIRNFIIGIKNLVKWFKIVWQDRDWDDHFIWQILSFKIQNQAKYIGGRNFHTRAKRDAEIMMTCVRLIEKIKSEEYGMEYMDYCEDDFKFVDSDKPGYFELQINPISENFDEYFSKRKTAYRHVMRNGGVFGEDAKKHIAMNMGRFQHAKAKGILFRLLENNIERWWY
jgi:hypothetical protein